ncbi:hypothetical protein [uncultured Sphingomonas sp.]|uniref:hypothetical protein n=1 Tax=uncultured Sphingomonas sp. TaxID=158754 RepID=UPI0025DAD1B2|nr:hypothetical protein [uncultured Sphingomonas sp.]
MQIGFESSLSSPLPLLLLRGPSTQLPAGIGEMAVSLNDAAPVTIHYGAFAAQDPHYRLLKLFPDKGALEALAAATSIRLEGSTMPPLHVTAIGTVLTKMDACMSTKLTA